MSGNSAIIARMGKEEMEGQRSVVSYGYELEARVYFYVEAVNGYDDTTDCSVRWVVYRSTIRQDQDLGPGTTTSDCNLNSA